MLRSVLLSALFTFVLAGAMAQTGSIKGQVTDAVTGEGVVAANVLVMGTTQGSAADINGHFEITNLKTGTYSLIISFVSYRTDTLENISVYPDQTTVVNTSLMEESQSLSEVVVSGQRMRNTDISVISEIKTSQLVVSGISAQQISLSQDRDAAQIVKRIPGVTILNNKFVNVRGLSERYSVVLLNGVIAPSTEVDSRAFAFDLIPSSMIDRMLVYKSGGANLPGDFAGAVIDIGTKSVIDENEVSVSFTAGFRNGTTFKKFNTEVGSNTDWLGFDNGYRSLPSSFPERHLSNYTDDLSTYRNRSVVGEAGASLNNNWEAQATKASPDLRTTINFSRSGRIGKLRLGNITSLSYSNTRQRLQQENYYYEAYDPAKPEIKPGRRYLYDDNRDASNVRLGLISNFVLEINPSHIIEFRNLYNQQGNSQVTERTGFEDVQNYEVNNLGLNYSEKSLYVGQLAGKHTFSNHLSLNWSYGYTNTSANQPDYRRIRSQRSIGSTDPFSVVIAPSANPVDGRFFSELTESIHSGTINIDYKLNPEAGENQLAKFSIGYYGAQTQREFSARWFSYNAFPNQTVPLDLLTKGFNEIFVRENLINPEDGVGSSARPIFVMNEGTNPSDAYTAENMYHAGYANFFKSFNSFKATLGVRIEDNHQQLNSADDKGEVNVDNPVTSVLPFANLSYNFNEKSLVRMAYSKTVNRPIFRELAPFNFYDFDRNANTYGFDSLKTANIHNVDLRWEYYPSAGENISIGVFYKHFIDPIETRLQQGSNIIYTFINAEKADNIGVELDARKSLDGLTNSRFVDNISLLFNAAFIDSKVTMPTKASNQEKERAMQGQSPYIVNASLLYSNIENGLQVNLAYNVFGKRIFAIGDFNQQTSVALNPTQYEMPRNQIDITISKDFGSHFNMKLGVQDILNQKYRLMQDSNSDKKITGFDDPIQVYKPGQYVTLGVTYRVN